MTDRLLVIGDVLLDRDLSGDVTRVSPDAPVPVLDLHSSQRRPGGAGLAAAMLAGDGWPVTLVTALSIDPAGSELAHLLGSTGVDLVDLGQDGTTPEKVRYRSGQTLLRVDSGRPGGLRTTGLTPMLGSLLRESAAILVSDYGNGITGSAEVRRCLEYIAGEIPMVWDPHPRGARPVGAVTAVTPNLAEAELALARAEGAHEDIAEREDRSDPVWIGRRLLKHWDARFVCITRGAEPLQVVSGDGSSVQLPVSRRSGDVCGAGDRFAASLTAGLAIGLPVVEAAKRAMDDASRFIADEGDGRPENASASRPHSTESGMRGPSSPSEVLARLESVRRQGGIVVATGGCFDLLHTGHVRSLEAAARLGDHLVVLVNSDRSTRQIKGPDRPLVSEEERALLLSSLRCVDDVLIFDQPTPVEMIRLLKPDVWAKGGDYEADELPERDELKRWGGRLAILPYVEERSTTRLIEEARTRATA